MTQCQYFSSHPPVYEKNTNIFVWNCALYSAGDVVFDCCAHKTLTMALHPHEISSVTVSELQHLKFSQISLHEKVTVKIRGRSTPDILISQPSKSNNKKYIRSFNSEWYSSPMASLVLTDSSQLTALKKVSCELSVSTKEAMGLLYQRKSWRCGCEETAKGVVGERLFLGKRLLNLGDRSTHLEPRHPPSEHVAIPARTTYKLTWGLSISIVWSVLTPPSLESTATNSPSSVRSSDLPSHKDVFIAFRRCFYISLLPDYSSRSSVPLSHTATTTHSHSYLKGAGQTDRYT
uniref:(California timema) hypothetical protein n=1 Tax=Timema californicum TaxID=61474 RepID=A0A7R9PE99_TIMCA|nr:unnamed protein product [Timema californicum]